MDTADIGANTASAAAASSLPGRAAISNRATAPVPATPWRRPRPSAGPGEEGDAEGLAGGPDVPVTVVRLAGVVEVSMRRGAARRPVRVPTGAEVATNPFHDDPERKQQDDHPHRDLRSVLDPGRQRGL